MKISSLDEYGLRCIVQLARVQPGGSLTIAELAGLEGLSPAYVGKLMATLKQTGLLESVRGRAGGYRLAAPPSEISVGRVLRTIGGPTWDAGACERFSGVFAQCVHTSGCSIRSLWGALDTVIDQLLGNVTLADLLANERWTADRLRAMQERRLHPATVASAPPWTEPAPQQAETQEV
jgi:Rrf2 family protein